MPAIRKDIPTSPAEDDGHTTEVISDADGRTYTRSVPDRPSQASNRIYTEGNVDAITASAVVYTISEGKTLYTTSWGGTIHNTSTLAMGHVRLRDGGANGTIIASWALPTAVAGAVAPLHRIQTSMFEPKQFSTDVYLEVVGGTITVCFQFTGYEE